MNLKVSQEGPFVVDEICTNTRTILELSEDRDLVLNNLFIMASGHDPQCGERAEDKTEGEGSWKGKTEGDQRAWKKRVI